jgi:hypothetical protein
MPSFRLKAFAVLLAAVFIGSGLTATISILSSKTVAGCHGQSHSKSEPQSGYQCCIAGHSSALQPNVCDTFEPPAVSANVISPIFVDCKRSIPAISETTASPPPFIALRI